MLQINHYNQQYLTEIFVFPFKPLKCETSKFKSPFWFNNLESLGNNCELDKYGRCGPLQRLQCTYFEICKIKMYLKFRVHNILQTLYPLWSTIRHSILQAPRESINLSYQQPVCIVVYWDTSQQVFVKFKSSYKVQERLGNTRLYLYFAILLAMNIINV